MKKRKIIDISTEEKKKEVFDKFDSFTSKNQAHEYFGISDNKQGSEYLKEIATSVGFNLNFYKERKKRQIRYCKQCGNEITSKWGKDFCCSACASKYNNEHRDKSIYEKIASKLKKDKKIEEKYCIICGKKLEGYQRKYCSLSCRNRSKYLNEGQEMICQECGKTFKSRDANRKFCSNECSSKYRNKEFLKKWNNRELILNPNSTLPKVIRNFLFEKAHYKCEECGFEGYNRATNNTILQIHHIDGNSGNNIIENLRVLCPNCHAMTENYMALNKGNSARDKRYEGGRNQKGTGPDC